MCLNPIRIKNKSKKIDVFHGDKLYIDIPCGKCSECKKKKQSDYMVRCYAEYVDTIEKGGYVFFETLTYSNRFVPKFKFNGKEYLCFSRKDFRHFFVRLRRYLDYDGYDVKNNLKYFFVCEYGGKTHRPHYHFLCFMKNKDISPYILKEYIRKSWKFGITDTRPVDKGIVNGIGALSYVAKYVVKDDDYVKLLGRKIENMKKYISENSGRKMSIKLKYRIDDIKPFHRQSKGFGIGLIGRLSDKELLDGVCSVNDKKMVKKQVALPDYIMRKVYYDCVYDDKGSLCWKLNDKGIERKVLKLDDCIDLLAQRYRDMYNNRNNYDIALTDNVDTIKYLKDNVDKYLNGRSWRDFAVYCYVYKGKLCDKSNRLNFDMDYHDFYKESLLKDKHILYDSHIGKDNDNFKYKTLKRYDNDKLVYDKIKYKCDYIENKEFKDNFDLSKLEDDFLIDENSSVRFKDFDKLYDLLKIYSYRGLGVKKEDLFNEKEELKSKFKLLNSLYK